MQTYRDNPSGVRCDREIRRWTIEVELTAAIKARARVVGFDLVGICPAVSPHGITHLREWLKAGHAGAMSYLPDRAEAYEHPSSVLNGVRSVIMLAVQYRTEEPRRAADGQGRVSRYAWGLDYHDVLWAKMRQLADFIRQAEPSAKVRGVVDTAPLLEREFAMLAGLGWIGKNTMLLNKKLGSWFFLAAVLTDLQLEYDVPFRADHCRTCRACLDACPTDAFVAPYVLNARRCISYLTIELKEAIPIELRSNMGDWVFGCDICQEVCPWNRRAPLSEFSEFQPLPGMNSIGLGELFTLDDESFRQLLRGSPLQRPKRAGLLRNAAIVLGNQPTNENVKALELGVRDISPIVRGAAAWSLGKHDPSRAAPILQTQLQVETDHHVRDEILATLRFNS